MIFHYIGLGDANSLTFFFATEVRQNLELKVSEPARPLEVAAAAGDAGEMVKAADDEIEITVSFHPKVSEPDPSRPLEVAAAAGDAGEMVEAANTVLSM